MSGTITMTGDELADLIRRMGKLKDQYFTVKEAAEYMRQRVCTVRGWISNGIIAASNPTGGKLLVRKRDLDGLWRTHLVGYAEKPEAMAARAENARKAVAAKKAKAAEREAREGARHGMAFGGARFSNRSWVEAFAARDKALKIERSDEDYNRLIDALGLKGKMTAAEAREAADALQREVKGGADVITDLVKAAEKKNFRRTVENIVTAAHGYGVEVGANARKAWEKYLSEMRRTAKGRDAEDFTTDMGLDIAAMLLNSTLERFDGKLNAPQTGEKTDEEAALEAALIDGTEGDMGLTAEEAQARLRELLEAKMGDVEERRKRLGEALDAWRSAEHERQRKLHEMQEERAAKETRADDTGDGKGKGERSEEEEEEEAVRELPDYKAFIERLKADRWNLDNAGEFAFVLRFYVEDWLAKKNGVGN